MMKVIACIVELHNPWLVILAGLICITGSLVTAQLFQKVTSTSGAQRIGWLLMTAIAAGVAIWSTHFVAMLGYQARAPIRFDPGVTVASLLIAVIGSTIGFVIGGSRWRRFTPALGGAIVGLAIAAMHYIGMMAYRVEGIVSWDPAYLVASVLLSIVLSCLALHLAMRPGPHAATLMASVLALAIVLLHFTGMTAFRVEPLMVGGSFSNPEAMETLAIVIAAMSFVIVGVGLVSFMIDDSARADSMERLRRLALIDSLTGLPNRANFNERLDSEIAFARDNNAQVALIGIDLNRFKEINDLRGHNAGDQVLRVLGGRIQDLIRDDCEFIARTGGDEFSGLYRIVRENGISDLLVRLEEALFRPIHFDGVEIVPGASIGVAVFPNDATDRESLINNADIAMYRAKTDPLRNICFYEADMDENIKARRSLAADLRHAVSRNELSLHYQVQTRVLTGEVRGYEALLRWDHPQRGLIGPTEFIPLAEENGLILQIGEWALRTACIEAATWEQPYKVAVNLSAVQFAHSDLPRILTEILVQTGLSPERLELELTESTIFAHKERAMHMLRQIKRLGVSIALDDFGTGYSSLDTLCAFPFDKLKIDRSFFASTKPNPQTTAAIRAALALGKTFGIPVLAEGIETADQLSMLKAEGCEEAQGFVFGRPITLTEIISKGQLSLLEGRTASGKIPTQMDGEARSSRSHSSRKGS